MQLLVLVLNKLEVLDELLTQMASAGISGATILNSTGMATTLVHHTEEDVPLFGILRKMLNPDREESKTIFTVLKEEQFETAKEIINRVTGGLSKPNTGIVFTLPINSVEGLVK